MTISLNITGKIDADTLTLLADLDARVRALNVEYMIIGAAARDMIFEHGFGIPTQRLTQDIDFGFHVAAWAEYDAVAAALLSSKRFTKDEKQRQRFRHHSGKTIDIVPFGKIENSTGKIAWPPDFDFEMTTLGFSDALRSSLWFRLRNDPVLDTRVCSPAGLAMLKLLSWEERKNRHQGESDAQDLAFLIQHYAEVEALHPMSGATIVDVPDAELDYERSNAWLLGNHIASMATPETRSKLLQIIEIESDEHEDMLLASQMIGLAARLDSEGPSALALQLLRSLQEGMIR